jgi:hypothetical protein
VPRKSTTSKTPRKKRDGKAALKPTDEPKLDREEGSEDDGESAETGDAEGEGDIHEPEGDGEVAAEEPISGSAIEPPASKEAGAITRFDPFTAYMREVQRHPVLTPEQTHDLAGTISRSSSYRRKTQAPPLRSSRRTSGSSSRSRMSIAAPTRTSWTSSRRATSA